VVPSPGLKRPPFRLVRRSATQNVGRGAALHVPCDHIAAARTNAAEPSAGQVHVTLRREFTAVPFNRNAPTRALRYRL